jgi:hypothetical protein
MLARAVIGEERELLGGTLRIGLRLRAPLDHGHDLGARGGVRGEHAVEANHVEAGRRHHRAEAREEVVRLEDERARAVAPGLLHGVPDASVPESLEPLLCDGRPAEVAAHALEAYAIAPVDDDLGVHVEAGDLGDRLVGTKGARIDDAQSGLSGACAEQVEAARGGGREAR